MRMEIEPRGNPEASFHALNDVIKYRAMGMFC